MQGIGGIVILFIIGALAFYSFRVLLEYERGLCRSGITINSLSVITPALRAVGLQRIMSRATT